jgi:hypothetical protein
MSSPDDTSPITVADRRAVPTDLPWDETPTRRAGELLRILGFAALPTVAYFVLVLRHITYAWDDFIQFGVTLQAGVSRDLLTYSLFEHFGPLNRLAHGVLLVWGGLDPRWAIVVCLPIFFAYCLALTDLARVLGAGWGRTAICVAVATVTPALVFVAAFLDPYFHVMVPITALLIATAAYVRWVRRRRWFHAATAAAAFLVACSVQERGLFIALFLVLARLLVIDGGVPVRAWVRTLLRDWPFLLMPALIALTTATIVVFFYAADSARGGVGETLTLIVQSWTMRLLPMVAGVYGAGSGALEVALMVLANVVIMTLMAWFVRRNAWNVRPLLLLVLWFCFNMAFVGFGRLGVGVLETFRDDPNFYAYAMPAVVIVIACLRPARAGARAAVAPLGPDRTLVAQFAVAAILAVLVLVSALPLAQRSAALSPAYLAASIDSVRTANESGPAVVAPTQVPYGLVPDSFFPYNRGEFLLREIDERTVVDVDPEAPRFLAPSGELTPARGQLLSRVEAGSTEVPWTATGASTRQQDGAFCLDATGSGHLSAALPSPVRSPGGAAWVRLIATGGSSYGTAAASDGTAWALSAPSPLTNDRGSVSVMVPATDINGIDLTSVRASDVCIEAIEVWALTADGADGCGWVGPAGEIVPARAEEPAPGCARD